MEGVWNRSDLGLRSCMTEHVGTGMIKDPQIGKRVEGSQLASIGVTP